MKDKKVTPKQIKGNYSQAEEVRTFNNRSEAIDVFKRAKQRLMDINNWHKYSGHKATTFVLTDNKGLEINREPRTGDLMRINLPGPGSHQGKGYDWVRLELLYISNDPQQDEDYCAILVRPTHDPNDPIKETAHFFTEEATSTFLIQRNDVKVVAAEKGRNEIANTKVKGILNKIRNKLFAIGASFGISHIQWKTLVKGFLKDEA